MVIISNFRLFLVQFFLVLFILSFIVLQMFGGGEEKKKSLCEVGGLDF